MKGENYKMSDFRARIVAELDDRKFRAQLANLTQDEKIKLSADVAVKNAEDLEQVKSDAKSLMDFCKKKFKLDIDEKDAIRALKQVQKEADKYQQQMQKQIKAQKDLVQKAFVEERRKNYQSIGQKSPELEAYKKYYEEQQKEADKYYKDYLKSTDDYINREKEKAVKVQSIRKKISQGFFDVDSSNVRKNLNKYSGVDSDFLKNAEDSYKKLISLKKELETGVSDDQFKKTLSDKDIISKYEQYNDILEKCQNQIKVLVNESGKLSKPFNSLEASTASNKTLTWLNNNTKAAKDYGDALRQLAERQKNATSTEELAGYNKEFRNIVSQAQMAGKTGKSFLNEFGRAAKAIGEFAGIYGVIQNIAFEVPKQMVQAVKDINAAQIELLKVSDAPTSQLTKYWDEAAISAQKYGAAINEVIASTADWSRLGYSLDDAKKLSDVTTLLQKVGDNMTQESSASGLISTLQGFRMQANEAEKIIDIANQVANTKPIDTRGIFEGLERSASSMSAANNTLEQTVALITTANSVVADPASVGTAFKTLSMRIRGAETELENAGLDTEGMAKSTAKLREEIIALSGVDIMSDDNTFKSTYDILDELSTKWKSLTDIQQASITELIAGKRQGNIMSALMENFDMARDTLNTALNESEGSANRELENYKKGIQYSLDRFKSTFQELSTATISSDLFKGVVDSGTELLSVFTNIIEVGGGIPAILTAIGGVKLFQNLDLFYY